MLRPRNLNRVFFPSGLHVSIPAWRVVGRAVAWHIRSQLIFMESAS